MRLFTGSVWKRLILARSSASPGSSGEKDNNSGKAGDMPGWVIPVIIVLSVLLIGAVAAVIVLIVLKKKKSQKNPHTR